MICSCSMLINFWLPLSLSLSLSLKYMYVHSHVQPHMLCICTYICLLHIHTHEPCKPIYKQILCECMHAGVHMLGFAFSLLPIRIVPSFLLWTSQNVFPIVKIEVNLFTPSKCPGFTLIMLR